MELYQIKTTAYSEEDMLLISDAPYEEIEKVLQPMVMAEREGKEWYDHTDYLQALRTALPQYQSMYIPEPTEIVL
jgi:hypothetical protein